MSKTSKLTHKKSDNKNILSHIFIAVSITLIIIATMQTMQLSSLLSDTKSVSNDVSHLRKSQSIQLDVCISSRDLSGAQEVAEVI